MPLTDGRLLSCAFWIVVLEVPFCMLPANSHQVPASVSSMCLGSGTKQSSIGPLEEGVGLPLSEQRARFHFELLGKQPSEPMFIEVWCKSLSHPLPISSGVPLF